MSLSKIFKGTLVLLLVSLFALNNSFALNHFVLTGTSSQNATVVVPTTANPRIGDSPLTAGDEIGVFDSDGNCWGAVVWNNANASITVYGFVQGDPDLGIPDEPGMPVGQLMKFRIWDNETDIEYTIVTATPTSGNLNYAHNKFSVLNNLKAELVPANPVITNPLNNAVGVPLSGNLTWNATDNTLSYDYTLSANADFSSPILNGNTTGTSVAYSGLSNGTTYYFRVRGKNAVGDGNYSTASWHTILPTVTLSSPSNNSKAQPLTVNFSWNSVTGATSYDFQLSLVPDFSTTVTNINVSTTSTSVTGLSHFTNYYWRVRARNGANYGNYSSTFTFQTKLAAPVVTNPLNNATGVPIDGTITWNATTGATFYSLQVADNPSFTSPIINQTNISATSLAYTNLNYYTNYYLRVKAHNPDGESDYTSTITFRTIVGIPTNQSPANNAFSQPLNGTLQWTSVTGATQYDAQIATDAGFTNIVQTLSNLPSNSGNYIGLNNATLYYWRARAKNSEGTGAFSNPTTFTTLIGPATLVSPANNATNVNPLSGSFTWNAPATATHYRIQVALDNGFTNIVIDQNNLSTTSYNYTNLLSKTQYYWRVYSFNVNNQGTWSNTFTFTTGLGKVVLVSPANGAQGIELNGVVFNWQSLNGATSYRFILSTNADLSSPIVNVGGISGTSYTVNGLNYNTTYYWGVRGQDGFGDGPLSDIRMFGTKVDKPTLVSPANNAIDVPLSGTFTWNATPGADSYQIQVSTVNDFSTTVINQSGITGTTYNYTALNNNTLHYWRVRGIKGGGFGEWSNVFQFTTIQLLPPNLVSPANNRVDVFFDVVLTWDTANQATAYDVQVATDINFVNIVATGNNLTVTQFSLTGLLYNTVYYWRARSKNSLGTSNWSSPYKFTTIPLPDYTGSLDVCENQQVTYTAPTSSVIDYQWYVTGGTIIGSSTTNVVTVKWTNVGIGKLKLVRSSAEWGSYTDFIEKNITVNPKDPVIVTIIANTYYPNKICISENVTYSAQFNKPGINEYYWRLNGNLIGTGPTVQIRFTSLGTNYITLEVFGTGCKNGEGLLTVNVADDCPLTVLTQNVSVCKNTSPTFYPEVFGGSGNYSYNWTPAADFVNPNVKDATVKNTIISKFYYIKANDVSRGNSVTKSLYMTVRQSPSISFNKLFYPVYNADPVDLTDPNVLIVTISGGTAPYTLIWRDINGNIIDPTEIYPPIGTSRYFATAIDANGCVSSPQKEFKIIRYNSKETYDMAVTGLTGMGYAITFPNPASDYINLIAEFAEPTESVIKVYNLIGELVLYTTMSESKQLDTQLDISKLPAGTYSIVIETFDDTIISRFIKK